VTGLLAHGVWLALVLGHSGVDGSVADPSVTAFNARIQSLHVLDNVGTDGRLEDIGKGE
jgi:hypothetical protein